MSQPEFGTMGFCKGVKGRVGGCSHEIVERRNVERIEIVVLSKYAMCLCVYIENIEWTEAEKVLGTD
jgi:hypothetical protein